MIPDPKEDAEFERQLRADIKASTTYESGIDRWALVRKALNAIVEVLSSEQLINFLGTHIMWALKFALFVIGFQLLMAGWLWRGMVVIFAGFTINWVNDGKWVR